MSTRHQIIRTETGAFGIEVATRLGASFDTRQDAEDYLEFLNERNKKPAKKITRKATLRRKKTSATSVGLSVNEGKVLHHMRQKRNGSDVINATGGEIARGAKIPAGGIHAALTGLAKKGLIEKLDRSSYRITGRP